MDVAVKIFAALGHENRWEIINLIGSRALCQEAIALLLNVTNTCAMQHLRILERAGLVISKSSGHRKHYSIDPNSLKPLNIAIETLRSNSRKAQETCERLQQYSAEKNLLTVT